MMCLQWRRRPVPNRIISVTLGVRAVRHPCQPIDIVIGEIPGNRQSGDLADLVCGVVGILLVKKSAERIRMF